LLTDVRRIALRYADDVFRTGRELKQALTGIATGERMRLAIGVADVIPKAVAERLLRPAVRAVGALTLVAREGPLPQLLACFPGRTWRDNLPLRSGPVAGRPWYRTRNRACFAYSLPGSDELPSTSTSTSTPSSRMEYSTSRATGQPGSSRWAAPPTRS
jgi:hypothetical protein